MALNSLRNGASGGREGPRPVHSSFALVLEAGQPTVAFVMSPTQERGFAWFRP